MDSLRTPDTALVDVMDGKIYFGDTDPYWMGWEIYEWLKDMYYYWKPQHNVVLWL